MADEKIKWTNQQARAIRRRGSNVLVTASAGTGKTAVLSGRCADIAADIASGAAVSQMLVLTFTDAAAEQMQQRIRQQLQAKLLEQPENNYIQTQLILLAGADIGTIHSFCRKIILEHFYKLSSEVPDPAFVVLDEDEQQLLKLDCLDKTLRWAWEQSNLQPALDQLFDRRDPKTESRTASKIISISEFLDSIAGRDAWFERAFTLTGNLDPLTGTFGKKQQQIIIDKIHGIIVQVRSAQKLYEKYDPGAGWSVKWNTFLDTLNRCIESHNSGKWQNAAEQILQFKKPRIDTPKEIDETIASFLKDTVKNAVDDFDNLKKLAVLNPDYLDKISSLVSIETRVLIELVRKFDRLYQKAKQAVGGLDFADLEHYALKILSETDDGESPPAPSQIARTLSQKYKYIFVDEYQDINPVQETILKLISRPDNVFVVGDVKQSIYAFRGAEPGIFLKNLQPASADPAAGEMPLRVDLNINFRSKKIILDFINTLFTNIMTSPLAGIDYDINARLNAVAEKSEPETKEPRVELHIIDKEGISGDDEPDADEQPDTAEGMQSPLSSSQHQAALTARRIRQMVGDDTGSAEFQIFDAKLNSTRSVRYGDIVILMRSPAKKINDYVKILRLAGIPVSSRGTEGYFEATEITDILSVLKILDNPQRDIEFASVLRSPLFNFSDSSLAEIKFFAQNNLPADGQHQKSQPGNFYDSALLYAQSGPDSKLAESLNQAFDRLSLWRSAARCGKLSDLIWQIYRETWYLSFVSALPSGPQRRANLLKLHDRAIQFENFASSGSFFSLARFVEFIEKLQQSNIQWSFAESPEMAPDNAVKITSIHKSKGLEFPVVILAELNTQFNMKDCFEDIIADADLGLAMRIIINQSNTKSDSLAHQVISEQKTLTNLAEEMRILYVAATRARERLILVGSEKPNTCRRILLEGMLAEKPFDLRLLRRCKNFLQWILLGLSGHKILRQVFEINFEDGSTGENLFTFSRYGQQDIKEFTEYAKRPHLGKQAAVPKPDTSSQSRLLHAVEEIKKDLNWKYPFEAVSLLPAKRTVSELSYANDDFKKIDYSKSLERKPAILAGVSDTIDSLQLGTAAHLLISNLDITKPVTAESIEQTKQNLVAEKIISPAFAQKLDNNSIAAFFGSDLGRYALDPANTIWREWPFTFSIPANQLQSAFVPTYDIGTTADRPDTNTGTASQTIAADESIIVQGIIDMLIKTKAGLIVIDFKTDNVSIRQAALRAENYKEQLTLYAQAAFAVLKIPVAAKWLYFLKPAQPVQIT
jgi:ATP-dependent helicase/nuclease subunit A